MADRDLDSSAKIVSSVSILMRNGGIGREHNRRLIEDDGRCSEGCLVWIHTAGLLAI